MQDLGWSLSGSVGPAARVNGEFSLLLLAFDFRPHLASRMGPKSHGGRSSKERRRLKKRL